MSDSSHKRTYHEAAHKAAEREVAVGAGDGVRGGHRPPQKRTFNEAAHKLGYWAPSASAYEEESEATRRRFEALEDADRDVIAHAGRAVLVLGALGVVYGDIGTSPLYTEQAIFTSYKATAHITAANVFGIASLIFWALMVVVSIKYAGFIMRAHNRGDGGIMALTALLQRNKVAHGALLVTLGIFGAALFFGDGIITPAISVLGAIRGVQVATPALAHLVVPLSVAILLGLFVLQRFGSGTIGWLFGPIILVWFTVIGLLGLSQVVKDPGVFQALSPTWAIRFLVDHGAAGYLVLGGVVLAVTGAEALYADRGHFGAGADPARLVRPRAAGAGAQLPRPGRLHPAPPARARRREHVQSVLPDDAALGAVADGHPRHVRDGDRLPGRDLGLVLGRQASRAARLPAAAEGPAHLHGRGPDLRPDRQLAACASAWSR